MERWLKHGLEVHQWYLKICDNPEILGDDKLTEWFKQYKPADLYQYHLFHDIGKPYCIEYDSEGKEHYPDHEEISCEIYCEWTGEDPLDMIPQLIIHDMDFHRARGDVIVWLWSLPCADHMYASAWASIEANAESFGGRDSDSYKIKRKQLLKCLKKRPK